ncbi:hypothetical protein SDC9_174440 [bioreactor metagenome]|uniref:Uncharacterized protein n=1 Tax=bioreactor metagenome TaxID=1076179 RepID=A0A645GTQ3_9ZZZZ
MLFFGGDYLKVKIIDNFAHIELGMCKVNEIKNVKADLAKQLIDAKLVEKVVSSKKVTE